MIAWLIKKIATLVPTLIGASLVAFFLIRWVPGDPVINMIGERGASAETIAQMRANLGLDLPIWQQYLLFVGKAAHGDLGTSILTKTSVSQEFFSRFPATIELSVMALFWAAVFGIPMGILAAIKRNTWMDYSVIGVSLVGYSMPIFWWGLILILFFSVNLGWLPVSGRIAIEYDVPSVTGFLLVDAFISDAGIPAVLSALKHLILPSIALGTIPLAVISRMTRSSLLEVLEEDFVRTAKAKGLSWNRVIYIHALRNALVPIVTIMGLLVGSLLTGAVLTETIFSWPGIGRWLVKSIEARDYPVIQAGIVYTSTMIVFVNLAVDMIYYVIYPRMRNLQS